MIISLFKNCASLKQFDILIEAFKQNTFHKKYCKKFNMQIGLHDEFQTAVTSANLILFIGIPIHKFGTIIQSSYYKRFDEDCFV